MSVVYNKGLHRFCILVSVWTFFLVVAGGLVTSTDSGLAVPDWPLSYGQLMPPMVGGILYEHGHRMIATFVGMLTIIMAVWLQARDPRKWVRLLGWGALALVIVQGLLGGLTVILLLPTAVSVAHAATAQSFFALTVFLSLVTSRWWVGMKDEAVDGPQTSRVLSAVVLVSVFLQLVLGALMRHTDSGLAVPDFPLAYGTLWPALAADAIGTINVDRVQSGLLPVTGFQVALHMLHRLWALVVTVLVILFVRQIFSQRPRRLSEGALLLLLLVLFQFLLGALTVWTGKNPAVSTAHVAVGSLILGCAVAMTAALSRGRISDFGPEFASELSPGRSAP